MEDVPLLANTGDREMAKQVMSLYGPPAYVRRARAVEEALREVVERCRRKREEWLPMVRLHLGRLRALAGDWERLRPWLAGEQIEALRGLHDDLAPQLRLPLEPTASARTLRRALRELAETLNVFNRRWQQHLHEVDLTRVNELRESYNRYYVLEKECVVRSPIIARAGFTPLPPATRDDVARLLPPLPTLNLRD
jgi:hypothetical protein